ncbi:MAG: hypothetical protein QM831_28515 [Kofleriaceae bacterium]
MDELSINARLLADPDDEELSILGDALQAIGDPRGDLIALQLAAKPLALDFGLSFERGWFALDFEYTAHYLTHWEPFAPWIRTIRVRAAGELLERFVEDLCRACSHLETLELKVFGPTNPAEACESIQWALDASPRLKRFGLRCDNTRVRPLDHPTVERVDANMAGAAVILRSASDFPPVQGGRWPRVTTFAVHERADITSLDFARIPSLHTLDLTDVTDGRLDAPAGLFRLIEANRDALGRLRELRLPKLDDEWLSRLRTITRDYPLLRTTLDRT